VASLKESQTAIYYLAGDDIARLENLAPSRGLRPRGFFSSPSVELLGDLGAS
jgi:hypothetical protein